MGSLEDVLASLLGRYLHAVRPKIASLCNSARIGIRRQVSRIGEGKGPEGCAGLPLWVRCVYSCPDVVLFETIYISHRLASLCLVAWRTGHCWLRRLLTHFHFLFTAGNFTKLVFMNEAGWWIVFIGAGAFVLGLGRR